MVRIFLVKDRLNSSRDILPDWPKADFTIFRVTGKRTEIFMEKPGG